MNENLGLLCLAIWVVFFFYVIFKYGDDKTSPKLTIKLTKKRNRRPEES